MVFRKTTNYIALLKFVESLIFFLYLYIVHSELIKVLRNDILKNKIMWSKLIFSFFMQFLLKNYQFYYYANLCTFESELSFFSFIPVHSYFELVDLQISLEWYGLPIYLVWFMHGGAIFTPDHTFMLQLRHLNIKSMFTYKCTPLCEYMSWSDKTCVKCQTSCAYHACF